MSFNLLIGSSFMIIGTGVGAGMLALPILLSEVDIITYLLILSTLTISAAATGITMIRFHSKYPTIKNFYSTMEFAFNPTIQKIGAILFTIFFYSLITAFLDCISGLVIKYANIPRINVIITISLILIGLLQQKLKWIDYSNRLATMLLLIIAISFLTQPNEGLFKYEYTSNPNDWLAAFPIIYLGLGFGAIMPSLVKYLNYDKKLLFKSLTLAVATIFILYFAWVLFTIDTLSTSTLIRLKGESDSVPKMIYLLQQKLKLSDSYVLSLALFFPILAIITSILGVSVGLFEYIQEIQWKHKICEHKKWLTALLVVAPPTLSAIIYPSIMINILKHSTTILVFASSLTPAVIAYKLAENKGMIGYNLLFIVLPLLTGVMVIISSTFI